MFVPSGNPSIVLARNGLRRGVLPSAAKYSPDVRDETGLRVAPRVCVEKRLRGLNVSIEVDGRMISDDMRRTSRSAGAAVDAVLLRYGDIGRSCSRVRRPSCR